MAVRRRRDSGNKPGIETTEQLGETSGDAAGRGEARPFLIVTVSVGVAPANYPRTSRATETGASTTPPTRPSSK